MFALQRLSHIMDVLLKKYFWVVNLVVITICLALLGRATAGVLVSTFLMADGAAAQPVASTPLPPSEPLRQKEIDGILARNIFCSACAPIKPTEEMEQDGPVDTTPQKSALPLQLLATMVSHDIGWSMGVIRDLGDERKTVAIYRRGDKLPQGAIVAQVVAERIYIVNGKRVEYIDQEGTQPPPAQGPAAVSTVEPVTDASGLEKDIEKGVRCTGSSCEVDRSLVDKLLANTTALATSARFVPSIKDGKPNGFKVYAVRPGSIFAKLGMQNADLVRTINGLDMSTPDKALEAYTKLKSASHLTMQIERRGESLTLDYQIR